MDRALIRPGKSFATTGIQHYREFEKMPIVI